MNAVFSPLLIGRLVLVELSLGKILDQTSVSIIEKRTSNDQYELAFEHRHSGETRLLFGKFVLLVKQFKCWILVTVWC